MTLVNSSPRTLPLIRVDDDVKISDLSSGQEKTFTTTFQPDPDRGGFGEPCSGPSVLYVSFSDGVVAVWTNVAVVTSTNTNTYTNIFTNGITNSFRHKTFASNFVSKNGYTLQIKPSTDLWQTQTSTFSNQIFTNGAYTPQYSFELRAN